VKNELSEATVLLEGRGGDIPFVCVSSKTGQGIDELFRSYSYIIGDAGIKS